MYKHAWQYWDRPDRLTYSEKEKIRKQVEQDRLLSAQKENKKMWDNLIKDAENKK